MFPSCEAKLLGATDADVRLSKLEFIIGCNSRGAACDVVTLLGCPAMNGNGGLWGHPATPPSPAAAAVECP